MKRRMLSLVLALVMCLGLAAPALACEQESYPIESTDVQVSEIVSINMDEAIVSEPMTYEEMIAELTQDFDETQEPVPVALSASITSATYRDLSVPLYVTSEFHPVLHFYCETSESGQYWGIVSIYSVQMERQYHGISKQFSGTVDVWLRSPYQIEYIVNGDFYNNGTTTVSGNTGLQLKVDELVSISFGVSGSTSSNHYYYFFDQRLVSFQT